jgi:glycosyltransferase involved in cell wall biosynthesis
MVVFHIFLMPVAFIASLLSGARVTVIVYGWDVSRNTSRLQRLVGNYADRMVAISRRTALDAESFLSRRVTRRFPDVVVLPPTVDTDHYVRNDAERSAFRAEFRYEERDILLLTVGRLEPTERSKGHDRVIRVLPNLLRDYPSLKYVIVGEGGDSVRLRTLAEEFGVAGVVRFADYRDQLRACYSACDVFVMPSTQEGFGIVFLEALACGLPVVAGGVDGSVSATLWGDLGYLCDPYEPASLERAIRRALEGTAAGESRSDPHFLRHEVVRAFGCAAFDDRLKKLMH